ncbi:nuclear transport factor 2 family protein [Larkinella rosea]|uniref:Nuclear transport factor 2 family protein n=2 Tax=Larkinella rosea TaxID=2025312 RepID=A0A3P1BJF2_9BACT|nr:nuclear transport factor 2 family protein [Larkinella rosea]
MVTEHARKFDHRHSEGIVLLRRSLNNALSIRYKIEPERVWRIISDVIDRHVSYLKLLHRAYEAFNNREIDGVLALMHSDVDWPNGWEGGYVHGHEAVRDYWTRQWRELDPKVTPVAFQLRPNGDVEVDVHQLVKDKDGLVVADSQVKHVYTIENGKIRKMVID